MLWVPLIVILHGTSGVLNWKREFFKFFIFVCNQSIKVEEVGLIFISSRSFHTDPDKTLIHVT